MGCMGEEDPGAVEYPTGLVSWEGAVIGRRCACDAVPHSERPANLIATVRHDDVTFLGAACALSPIKELDRDEAEKSGTQCGDEG